MHRTLYSTVSIVLSAVGLCGALSLDAFGLCPVYETGAQQMAHGDYDAAIALMQADSVITDSAGRSFTLGIAYLNTHKYHEALHYLKKSARTHSALMPCAYEHIGRAQQQLHGTDYAISAYRSAASQPIPYRYKIHLQKHIFAHANRDSSLRARLRWFNYAFFATEPVRSAKNVLQNLIDDMVETRRWDKLDSLLSKLGAMNAQAHICSLVSKIDACDIPDSAFSTARLFQLSEYFCKCRKYDIASRWLHNALDRADFNASVSRREYLEYRCRLNYKLKNYHKSIRWAKTYLEEFSAVPEIIITLARNYRYIGQRARSTHWYDMHIEKFPRHAMTANILWYRAWQKEESGNLDGAAQLFTTLHQRYGHSSKADDAFFRAGLCYYKLEKYEKARAHFDSFIRTYPRSSLRCGAYYWKAKSLFRLHRYEHASQSLRKIFSYSITDYYSYRAREMLYIMRDSSHIPAFSAVESDSAALDWLVNHSGGENGASLTPTDSARLYAGTQLALCGLETQSEYYLNPLSYTYQNNRRLQFFLAHVFSYYRNPTYSYRSTREIYWNVPLHTRPNMPRRLYKMLYPTPFKSTVISHARTHGVDPLLVYSVMRQESIFDMEIVSPVGAIGLMQLMPYTAKDVAQTLGETQYAVDSLYHGKYNVKFGTYYLGMLLDKYDNNKVLALSAYNAGPGNASRWYNANKGCSFDIFVENISYSETRKYVKKVLANYWTYTRLYGNGEYGELIGAVHVSEGSS